MRPSYSVLYFVERASGRSRMSITCLFTTAGFSSRAGTHQGGTHYDTLEISPNATQNEIKSAYYKLTMQYHPDKNQSRAAKEKFQDISNAYSVLGNHNSRKDYDRKMLIKCGKMGRVYTNERAPDYTAQRYQAPRRADTTVMYDIDRWTQEHYKSTFKRAREMKQASKSYAKADVTKRSLHKERMNILQALLDALKGFSWFCLVILGSGLYVHVNDDPDSYKRNGIVNSILDDTSLLPHTFNQ